MLKLQFLKPYLLSSLYLTAVFGSLRILSIFLYDNPIIKDVLVFPVKITSRFLFEYLTNFSIDFLFFLSLNGIFFIFDFICDYKRWNISLRIRRWIFYFLNSPLFVLFFIDLKTITVQGKIVGQDVLSLIRPELFINSWIFIRDYWDYSLIVILTLVAVYFTFCKSSVTSHIKNPILSLICFIILFCYSTVALHFNKYSYFFYIFPYNQLANGLHYRLFYEYQKKKIRKYNDYRRDRRFYSLKELRKILQTHQLEECESEKQKKDNIILIIIERFQFHFLSDKHTPFINKLATEGLLLDRHLHQSFSTKESVAKNILQSHYGYRFNKDVSKWTSLIKNLDYQTIIFFGDKRGSYFFDDVFEKLRVDKFYGAEDYLKDTGKTEHKGPMGDIDEAPFFEYASNKLKHEHSVSPFFVIILTNQPHYPYHCPPYVRNGEHGDYNFKLCLKYVDESIQKTFEELKNETWFKDTLFIITADHALRYFYHENGVKRMNYLDQPKGNYFSKYHLPLIFWKQNKDFSEYKNKNRITTHMDIIPSLLHYMGHPMSEQFVLPNLIFCKEKKNIFVYSSENENDNTWFLIRDRYLLSFDLQTGESHLYEIGFMPVAKAERKNLPGQFPSEVLIENQLLKDELERLIKAYIQHYYFGFSL